MGDGLDFFDAVVLLRLGGIDAGAAMRPRLAKLGLLQRAIVVTPDPRLVERRVVVAMTHRAAMQRGLAAGAQRLLVIEEGALLHGDGSRLFAPVARALSVLDWRIVALGGAHAEGATMPLASCPHVQSGRFEGCFANGYSRAALEELLTAMPAEAPRMGDWIAERESFDAMIAGEPGRVLTAPRIASLPHLLPYEDPALRTGFLP